MIDLCERVQEHLVEKGFDDVYGRRLDMFSGKEGTVIRPMPGTVVESYYDGTQVIDQPYQIVVRRRDEAEAMQTCSDIAEALEGVTIVSANGSYEPADTQGQQVYVRPQELALEEEQFYAWHVRMRAMIER